MLNITSTFLLSKGFSQTIVNRFWAKVQITESCWLWTGSRNDSGYGLLGTGKASAKPNMIRAHVFSWLIHRGEIPDGLWVLHDCPNGDNPACVNPYHLWVGTPQDNSMDSGRKNRTVFGPRNPMAKLKEYQVQEMRERYALGGISFSQLAKMYGISTMTCWKAVRRHQWQRVP